MTDIVERLLNWECGLANAEADMVREAADEIERLRETVVAADREIKRSHADADRLRAALDEQVAQ